MSISDIPSARIRERLQKMVEAPEEERRPSGVVPIRSEQWNKKGLHPRTQIMPLIPGITSGHLIHVALSHIDEGKWKEAEHAARLALSFNPQDPDALHTIGLCRQGEGDTVAAELYFRRALRALPQHCASLISLGELLFTQQKYSEAGILLEHARSDAKITWDGKKYAKNAHNLLRRLDRLIAKDGPLTGLQKVLI